MAQTGIPGTLYEIDINKLGEISGAGGLIGSAVYGYQYFPLKDSINFEEVVPAIVVDKIRVPSNLPNRTNPNKVENQTTVIDVYVCVPPNLAGTITTISPSIEPLFIPAHLITKIAALPKVECCDVDDNDVTQSLALVPSLLNMGGYVPTYPTDVVYPLTMQYAALTLPVTVELGIITGQNTNWLWKKSSDTTYVQIDGNPLYYSVGELNAGGGYLDIDIKFNDLSGAIGVDLSLTSTINIVATGEGGALVSNSSQVTISMNDLSLS